MTPLGLRYYSTQEAADLLGVSGATIRQRIYEGQIRWIDVGTTRRPRIRISQEDLRAWLEAARSDPSPTLRKKASAIAVKPEATSGSTLRYYSTEEVAKLLGVNGNTIRRKIHAGEIRWSNIGTPERPRVRISEEDLKAWMDAQASRPAGTERKPRHPKWAW